ncbi:hypothetical protein B0H16DRAFT_1696422 [Mycena metata]|uniref:Uncharacterized protein n=1 Tax=Mycena metata TaxID=1033252 RepID=A0AAD7I0R5_9AGAR|nr:hypothetical protein B0H16DRAFT_1696422 [Mycena metata]
MTGKKNNGTVVRLLRVQSGPAGICEPSEKKTPPGFDTEAETVGGMMTQASENPLFHLLLEIRAKRNYAKGALVAFSKNGSREARTMGRVHPHRKTESRAVKAFSAGYGSDGTCVYCAVSQAQVRLGSLNNYHLATCQTKNESLPDGEDDGPHLAATRRRNYDEAQSPEGRAASRQLIWTNPSGSTVRRPFIVVWCSAGLKSTPKRISRMAVAGLTRGPIGEEIRRCQGA